MNKDLLNIDECISNLENNLKVKDVSAFCNDFDSLKGNVEKLCFMKSELNYSQLSRISKIKEQLSKKIEKSKSSFSNTNSLPSFAFIEYEYILITLDNLLFEAGWWSQETEEKKENNFDLEYIEKELVKKKDKLNDEMKKKKSWRNQCFEHENEFRKYIQTIRSDFGLLENDITHNKQIPIQAFDSPDANIQKMVEIKAYMLPESQKSIQQLLDYLSALYEKAKTKELEPTASIRFENILENLSSLAKQKTRYKNSNVISSLEKDIEKLSNEANRARRIESNKAEASKQNAENYKKMINIGLVVGIIFAFCLNPFLGIIVGIIIAVCLIKPFD